MPILIRVRSKDGLFRCNVEPSDDISKLLEQLQLNIPNADLSTITLGNQPRGGPEMKATEIVGNSIGDLGLKHGHLLYANYTDKVGAEEPEAQPSAASSSSTRKSAGGSTPAATAGPKKPWELAEEEPIDAYWASRDGKIPRQRDTKFCRHGVQGMCDYCMPLEPYDARYQTEKNIKHLSYHAHLRKLNAGSNKGQGTSWIPPLEEADYTVKVPCPSGQHPEWPAGICTKCQPSAITLQRQTYRMVDHVEFSQPDLIENLLKFWRSTASQRFGFLLGRYEPYADVPMGIKAVVEAIHEPPQEGELDGVTIGVPWEDQPRIDALAKQCGLQFVGMIYSDLTADTKADEKDSSKVTSTGKVLCKRHKDSFFLSGNEVLFAGALQNANSTSSRMSASGRYNSRFVTCVLTGNLEGEVGVEAYQVSEQAMSMVKADMIEASVSPSIIRIKPSDSKRYVPEVFFRYKNEYGLDVKESAKPTFPVEYLIVNVTNGFPTSASPRFLSSKFPIENRQGLTDQGAQNFFHELTRILGGKELLPLGSSGGGDSGKGKGKARDAMGGETMDVRKELTRYLSDWHLLSFVQTLDLLGGEDIAALCKLATSHDEQGALDELITKPGWQTLVTVAKESAPAAESTADARGGTGGGFGGSFGEALDDELTAEEIAAIIASTEGDFGGGGGGASAKADLLDNEAAVSPTISDFQSAPTSRRSSNHAQPQAPPLGSTTYAARSSSAAHPVGARPRRAGDLFEFTGEEDDPIEIGDDEDDDDFQDVASEEEDNEDVTMTSAPPASSRGARAAPAAAAATRHEVMDLTDTEEGDEGDQRACPTCTVLNRATAIECHLCGLPMSLS
ncbi:NPL4-domain-containing protein [Tilletiaria anomala UBC 951]|uniref:Nuclear protein localization protein 4 n=1 Tax=Tilletiaria anomala (strain ATCC 24038 / CBS 436.72 / UBC 951) TaxID=1037660 RepID=A0A066W578_TILAU|nr:NPL4-domain-containing protein [Tilletiaria anomala UBC 951]KDN45915.1 NPL4-domain-containing protein [Tilletiaria anomala UBC 951]